MQTQPVRVPSLFLGPTAKTTLQQCSAAHQKDRNEMKQHTAPWTGRRHPVDRKSGRSKINSQPRPVRANTEADFPARKNKLVDAAFAPYTPGFSAEQHKYGPWKPI